MAKIRMLSKETINQIAAGEVVESPASIVKELVENSVDAGAKQITIEIKGGGHLFLAVTDDGKGMSRDDALLSLERHATSKIREIEDLSSLVSMGFRGEALATIAAISKLRLQTKVKGEEATEILCHGGEILHTKGVARGEGTRFEISAPFYNTPARKKFQKSATQSTNEIVRTVSKLALAHKDVAFKLISQGKTLIETSEDPSLRIEEILPSMFVNQVRKVDYSELGYTLEGVVGSPLVTKGNRSQQYILLNHRPIYSKLICDAIQDGYGTRINKGEFPIAVLYLTAPADLVDVNVHPQKHTVRFQDERIVRTIIQKAIEESLVDTMEAPIPMATAPSIQIEKRTFSLSEPIRHYQTSEPIPEPTFFAKEERREEIDVVLIEGDFALVRGDSLRWYHLPQVESRIHFEAILTQLTDQTDPPIQALLFPESIQLSPQESENLLANLSVFKNAGFDIRVLADHKYEIEGLAPYLSEEKAKEMLLLVLDEVKGTLDLSSIAWTIASKAHPEKYDSWSTLKLLEKLAKCKDQQYGPRGDLLYLEMGKEALKEAFKKGEYAKH